MNDPARPAVILGAGLTGLTLATALSRAGRPVIVLERSERPGGVIRSVRRDGFLAEESANSMMIKAREVEDFLGTLGLGDQLVEANAVANKRFLMRDGRVLAMPMSLKDAVATPLYSFPAKLRLLKEPFVGAGAGSDESVAEFVRRRMGREFLDYGIAALVSGIFAGDPQRLSVRYAFPKVWNLEASYGSLIGGAVRLMRERKREGVTPYKSRIVSFREGLETLPRAMAAELGEALIPGARVQSIAARDGGWRVAWSDSAGSHETHAGAVVPTVPLAALAALPWQPDDLAEMFAGIPKLIHPPVTTLSLGYRRDQVAHPLDGFGLLAPLVEKRRILGAIFSSTLFPGRAPEGHVLFIVFMGGATRPEMAARSESEAVAVAGAELGEMFGVTGEPVFVHHRHWPAAIPQYDVGHGEFLAALQSIENRWPGLHIQGNFRGGPGVNDCIASALSLAGRLA